MINKIIFETFGGQKVFFQSVVQINRNRIYDKIINIVVKLIFII